MFGKKKRAQNQRATAQVAAGDALRQAANALLANIEFSSVDSEIKSVAVTSAAPNEGKSTVSLALAIAAGNKGKRTLIVENDLRRRSLGTALNTHPEHGLHAVLTKKASLEEAATATAYKNLDFLDAEAGLPNPEEILASQMYGKVIREAREAYDFVVVDTPPVGVYADALMVSREVDGTLLVIREGETKRKEAQLAVEQLRGAGAHILGLVMNCQSSDSAGSYGYYGYYYEEKTVPADSPEARQAMTASEQAKGQSK